MTTAERKKKLIASINNTDNDLILEDLQRILEFESNNEVYILSHEQKLALAESRADYKNGNYISDEEINVKIDKWLEE